MLSHIAIYNYLKSLEFNSVAKYVTRNIHVACLVKVRIQRWWYS